MRVPTLLIFLFFVRAVVGEPVETIGGQEFVKIPAGKFPMGIGASVPKPWDKYKWDYPQHEVEVSGFSIAKYPVTVAEFGAFLREIGFTPELGNKDVLLKYFTQEKAGVFLPKEGFKQFPVAGVSYRGAVSYCEWFGKKHGRDVRLPTEAQWEYAARGTSGRTYPWGEKSIHKFPIKCAVGQHPELATPEGVHDLIGPVYQWCLDSFEEDFYKKSPAKDPVNMVATGSKKVIRGYAISRHGSFLDESLNPPPAWRRYSADPKEAGEHFGFRLVMKTTP